MGKKLSLTMACSPYDRLRGMMDGTCEPEGIDLNFIPMKVEEIFWRQLRYNEFDISEMSLSSYMLQRSRNDERYISIPVFTSRVFRHNCIFVNTDAGIREPKDLIGKTVGVPEYQMTACLWIRGIMQDEYGVKPSDITWRSGGQEMAGRIEKLNLNLPADIEYAPIPSDRTLNEMLVNGEIDALFTGRMPSSYAKGDPRVARLFQDSETVEREYFKKTGIFPIMHTVVIKRELYDQHPWVAMSLFKALCKSKDQITQNIDEIGTLNAALPFLLYEVARTKETMGNDWWPYGIESNRKTLEAMTRYSFEQGLSERHMTIEELFAQETFTTFKI